ncbi:carnitine O-palmitoyltransferase 2, mitochondrial isoform X2 [Prorops nasuta]
MHFQPSLPRLPIPKLEDTANRYLNAQRPILNNDQLNTTISYVNKFLSDEGLMLNKALLEENKKNKHTSYITEPWFDMYLKDRKPLPINYNPFLVFTQESSDNNQLVKITNLIVSSLRFMKSLRAGILEPEVYHLNPKKSDTELFRTITNLVPSSLSWYAAYLFKAFPLDMSQYHNLFNSTRLPELGKDRIYQNTSEKHIVVSRRGHFYAFNVLDEAGYIHPPKEIAACLKSILDDNRPINIHSVGVLTASERDFWCRARYHLIDIGNRDVLKKIDSALFMVNLDDDVMQDNKSKLIRNFLHSDAINRWFDKSFSIICTKDGYAGINFEHSWGDGVAVLRYFQDVKKDITEKPWFHPHDIENLKANNSDIHRIEFVLDTKAKGIIAEESKKYKQRTQNLAVDYLIIEGFGKNECKSFNVSPDAIMQLAFQLAFYMQEGHMVPTYESCSTAAFKHGRTETIRPVTLETKAVCSALTDKNSKLSTAEIKNMIVACSKAHSNLTKNAAMGQGFDRHLFALKNLCQRLNKPLPDIFKDKSYEYINHNILSTSTLSSSAVMAGGFGPVVDDGYGIGYMIQDKLLGSIVTSYQDKRSASDYIKNLDEAFKTINKVMLHK